MVLIIHKLLMHALDIQGTLYARNPPSLFVAKVIVMYLEGTREKRVKHQFPIFGHDYNKEQTEISQCSKGKRKLTPRVSSFPSPSKIAN